MKLLAIILILVGSAFGQGILGPILTGVGGTTGGGGGGGGPLVHSTSCSNDLSTSTTLSCTLSATSTAGNALVVVTSVSSAPDHVTSVTGNNGGTFTQQGTFGFPQNWDSTASKAVQVWVCLSCPAQTSVNIASVFGSAGLISMNVREVSGVTTVDSFAYGHDGGAGGSTAMATGNLTFSASGDFIAGGCTHLGTLTTTAGTGFSDLSIIHDDPFTGQPLATEDRSYSSTTSIPLSMTLSSANTWICGAVALK